VDWWYDFVFSSCGRPKWGGSTSSTVNVNQKGFMEGGNLFGYHGNKMAETTSRF
jgi:hypothetical protein